MSIPIGYAGVTTSLSGEQAPSGQFANDKQKDVHKDVFQPGLYYVNAKEYNVDVPEIGINQVSLLGEGGSKVVTKAQAYARWVFADTLNPRMKLNIIHAGEGMLWTDLEKTGFAELGGAQQLKNEKQ